MAAKQFKPALIVVDLQQDFCPPPSLAGALYREYPRVELVPELEVGKIDLVIKKGQVKDVEMYSAFYPPLENPRVGDSGLASALRKRGASDVYVVGLAADYCVKEMALYALGEGLQTHIVEEGTKPVDVELWNGVREKIREVGVQVVSLEGYEMKRVKEER